MQKQKKGDEKEGVLKKLQKAKQVKHIKIVTSIIIILILLGILIFSGFSVYNYMKSPEKQLALGADIEQALISQEGNTAFLKLEAGSNIENITRIKFIFKDTEGGKHVYETTEGIQQISIPYERTFLDIILGFLGKEPDFQGVYDYEIDSSEIDLDNFENIEEVGIVFEYETKEGEVIETPELDTASPTPVSTVTGGGGGGGGTGDGGTTPSPSCTDTCTSLGYDCGIHNICGSDVDCGICAEPVCNTSIPDLGSGAGFMNFPINYQDNIFTVEFDVTPNNYTIDGLVMFSDNISSDWYDEYSVLIRFNISSYIDAYDSGIAAYKSDNIINYTKETKYHVKFDVNISSQTYDVYVDGQLLADNYVFRKPVTNISFYGLISSVGSLEVCDMDITSSTLLPPALSCSLTNASWNPSGSVTEGDSVDLIVEGANCDGENINFTIYENDVFFDDYINSFVADIATASWIAQWFNDAGGDPEYYFIATLVNNQSESINSKDYGSDLSVSERVVGGNEYYVSINDSNCDDNGNGASAVPWCNLNRSYTWDSRTPKVAEGDTVYFRNGNYGDFTEDSKIPDAPYYRTNWITYKADAGHTPILSNVLIYNKDLWNASGNGFIDGDSYLIFDGFNIPEGVSIGYTSFVQLRNSNISNFASMSPYNGPYAPYVYSSKIVGIRTVQYITIENNDISYGYRGIFLQDAPESNNIVIRNNTIHRLGDDGIVALPDHLLIEGNTIFDIASQRSPVHVWGTKTGNFIEGENITQEGTLEQGIVDTPPGGLGTTQLKYFHITANRVEADPAFNIIEIDNSSESVNVSGDQSLYFNKYGRFKIHGSHENYSNDGIYTINSLSYDSGTDTLTVYVSGDIVNNTAPYGSAFPDYYRIVGQTSGANISMITKVDGSHTDCLSVQGSGASDIVIRGNTLIRGDPEGSQCVKISTNGAGVDPIDDIVFENNLVWAPKPIIGNDGKNHEYGQMNILRFNNNTLYGLGSWGEGDGIVNTDLNITEMYNNIFASQVSAPVTPPANHGNNIFRYEPAGFTRDPITELVYFDVENLFKDAANGDFHPLMSEPACPGGANPLNLGAEEYIGALECVPGCVFASDCPDVECKTNKRCETGMCVYDNVLNGTSCTDDGLFCTGTETCQSGSCVSSGHPCLTDQICIEPNICQDLGHAGDFVNYWRFEDNLNDEMGNNDGTAVGDPQYVDGVIGKALEFEEDYVEIGTGSDYSDLCVNGCTFSFWTRLNEIDKHQTWIDRWQGGGEDDSFFILRIDTGEDTWFAITDDGNGSHECRAEYGGDDMVPDTWYHVVGVYNLTDTIIYREGNYTTHTTCSFNSINETAWQDDEDTGFGAYASYQLNGTLDEVMIYDKALNSSEVLQIYEVQKAPVAKEYYVSVTGNGTHTGLDSANAFDLSEAQTEANSRQNEELTFLLEGGDYGSFVDETNERTAWVTWKANDVGVNINTIYIDNNDLDSYLIFDGFEIPEGVAIKYTSYIKVLNSNITRQDRYSPQSGPYAPYVYASSGVFLRNSHYIIIQGNNISYSGNGIAFGGAGTDLSYVTIKDNHIHRLAGDGIQVSSNNLLIEDNIIEDIANIRSTVWIRGDVEGTFEEGEIAVQPGSGEKGIVDTPPDGLGTFNLAVMQTTSNRFTEGGGRITGLNSGANLTGITKVDGEHTDATEIQDQGINDVVIRNNRIIREGIGGSQALKFNLYDIADIIIENNIIWAPKPIMGGGSGTVQSNIINLNNNTFYSLSPIYGEGEGITEDFNITNMHNNIFGGNQPISTVLNHGNNIFMYEPTGFTKDPTELVYFDVQDLFVDAVNGDFSPLMSMPACNGSVTGSPYNESGSYVGALPCWCTADSDCPPDGGTCDIPTGTCSGELGTTSFWAAVINFLKGLLTRETGQAILTGKVVGIDGIDIEVYDILNKTKEIF